MAPSPTTATSLCVLVPRVATPCGVNGNSSSLFRYLFVTQGRGLATAQIERTLRVFETAEAIDLSNNEIERIPSTIPHSILALDISFNLIASADGIDRLKDLQELHLGFNRLVDVSILEFCPRLQRVNLSGNRCVLEHEQPPLCTSLTQLGCFFDLFGAQPG